MAGALFPSDTESDRLLVGPESVAWRSTSDVRLNFAVLYPLLLQVAHPTIDAAVGDYSALEPAAYAWVHATLVDAFVRGTACFTSAMSEPETDRFYREYRGLGRLIGVRERDLPPTWARFRSYFRRTAPYQLTRTASV